MRAKFEVYSCNRSRHMEGAPKFENMSRHTFPTPLPNLHFFVVSTTCGQYVCQIWSFKLQLFKRLWGAPKLLK